MNQSIENMGVTISNKTQHKIDKDGGGVVTKIDTLLATAIQKLIKAKPLWKFVVTDIYCVGDKEYKATAFELFEDGQYLGKVFKTYARNDYRIGVENHRISETRTRRSAYSTSDPDKAVTTVKKMFHKMNLAERSKKQESDAKSMMTDVMWDKKREAQSVEHGISTYARQWALNEGYEYFFKYISESARHMLIEIDKKEEMFGEMMIMDDVTKAYDTGRAALVIVDGSNYIIKRGEHVGVVNASDMTDDMKAKIGMLKLVNDRQFVSSVGAKVSPESYIVLDGADNDNGD